MIEVITIPDLTRGCLLMKYSKSASVNALDADMAKKASNLIDEIKIDKHSSVEQVKARIRMAWTKIGIVNTKNAGIVFLGNSYKKFFWSDFTTFFR